MSVPLLFAMLLAAGPSPEQLTLLTTFRNEFIRVTPGEGVFPKTFVRGGSSQSQGFVVAIDYPFAIAKYEVPQNLWEAVMGTNPSKWKGDRNSVEMISFEEAEDFCRRATKLMREASLIEQDEVIRLPSEAEWEYVARSGTNKTYSFGSDPTKLGEYAWYTGNAAGNDPPVGAKKPNPGGLYDVHGYLWEWCADAWHPTYEGAPADGRPRVADGDAPQRVLRGGSWKDAAEKLTCDYRRPAPADLRDDAVGLRCVLCKERK